MRHFRNFTAGLIERLLGLTLAVCAAQFPLYYGQYLDTLGGVRLEAENRYHELEREAAGVQLSVEDFVTRHEVSPDPVFVASGRIHRNTVSRYQHFQATWAEMATATPWRKPLLLHRNYDADLAHAFSFRPGLPFNSEGASWAAIGLLAGWLLTNQILRPIEAIQKTAQSISETNLSERINVAKTHSEVGGLAHVLNSMFARLQAAFERQTQFAADASHELRTPLAVIHTEAESALNKPRSPEEYSAALETCLRAAKRMRPLVESLLVLARGDAGKLQLRRETFDLKNTVEDCAALVESLAAERKVSLTLDLQPVQLHADPFRLTQVVANILTNAILYNRPGGTAQATLRSENNFAILTISDTGLGIPPEHLPRIFERFYRVEESRSRELGGAGLGLAICKSIIDAHQGTITATSEVHYGTTFVVRLPLGC